MNEGVSGRQTKHTNSPVYSWYLLFFLYNQFSNFSVSVATLSRHVSLPSNETASYQNFFWLIRYSCKSSSPESSSIDGLSAMSMTCGCTTNKGRSEGWVVFSLKMEVPPPLVLVGRWAKSFVTMSVQTRAVIDEWCCSDGGVGLNSDEEEIRECGQTPVDVHHLFQSSWFAAEIEDHGASSSRRCVAVVDKSSSWCSEVRYDDQFV